MPRVKIRLNRDGLKVIEENPLREMMPNRTTSTTRDNSRFSWHDPVVSCRTKSCRRSWDSYRFDGALYSSRARENAVMMVARPRGIPEGKGKAVGVDLRRDELRGRPATPPPGGRKIREPLEKEGEKKKRWERVQPRFY